MAKLYLKGIPKPLIIEKSTAVNLNRILDDSMVPADRQFDKDGIRFSKRDIRYVIENDQEDDSQTNNDTRKQENEEYYNKQNADFKNNVVHLCKRSVEEKANDVKLFITMYFGVTGKQPSQEALDQVIAMQKAYFDVNPKHPYAKVNYFKLVNDFPVANREFMDMKYGVASFSLRIVDRIIGETFNEAYFMKLI